MMLVALKEIPNSVAMIPAGQQFIELDPERAAYWVKAGFAEEHASSPTAPAPRVNSRGWDGLFWDDATVCIMASGPSMSQDQADAVRSWSGKGRHTIAINTTFQLAPWADVLYACDDRWWSVHYDEVKEKFYGQLWSQDEETRKRQGIRVIRSERKDGLSKTPGIIRQGMSSGYQAMNLAYLAGAKKLLLLGFDCKPGADKRSHWHGDHPAPLNNSNPFPSWIKKMETLAVDLAEANVEVVNLTPGSAIRCFRFADWKEVLL